MMDAGEKSDSAIVATKPTNNAGRPVAEPVERRAETEGNAGQQRTRRAQDRESVSQVLERIRQAARQRKQERFTALFHHLSSEMLRTAFFALRREAAPGLGKPETCDFLGFTFACGKSRRGRFLVERKTRRDRMRAKLREIKEEL